MRLLLLAAALLVTASTGAGVAAAGTPTAPAIRLEAGPTPPVTPTAVAAPSEQAHALAHVESPSTPGRSGAAPRQSNGGSAVLVGADRWHAAGFSGHGVRVAIIDPGFSGYEAAFADAVPPVRAHSFRADGSLDGGSAHGLRAAWIVHELAPRAQLLLLTFSTIDELAAAVDFAIEEGVDAISFSVGFVHNGPGDGSGPVNELVDRATEAGVLWATAAGNWARQHWAGPFSDEDGDGVHEFGDGAVLNGRHYMAGDLISASLRWSDEWGAACSDYDLELVGPDGALVLASRRVQDCDDDPVEGLRVLATTDGVYSARIVMAPGAAEDAADTPHTLSLLLLSTPDRDGQLDSFKPDGSLAQPADHPAAVAVGSLSASGEVASFSSRGPTSDERNKPDLLAPTTLASADEGEVVFGGTSAAAPLVAGVAALLKEARPELTREELTTELRARARPLAEDAGSVADAPEAEPAAAIVQLGSLDGLGPLLPEGGREATLNGERSPEGGLAAFTYQGPDGYPVRFLHLLLDDPLPRAIFRYDASEERWRHYIPLAPAWVNNLDAFKDGDEIWMRFDPPDES